MVLTVPKERLLWSFTILQFKRIVLMAWAVQLLIKRTIQENISEVPAACRIHANNNFVLDQSANRVNPI
jgi:hypothetical protein